MSNVNENEWILSKLGKLLGANDIHKWMGCIVTSVNFFLFCFTFELIQEEWRCIATS